MNNRGQALVEFVLILPVFLMILFVIVDFGVIFSSKAKLENDTSDIVELLNNNTTIDVIRTLYKDMEVNIIVQDGYQIIRFKKKVNLITPGMNRILDDPYILEIERVIPYEA